MASLRFSSFGAATVPLSKIVVDKALDMGQYPIKLRPEEWATETLDWGEKEPEQLYQEELLWDSSPGSDVSTLTAASNDEVVVTLQKVPNTGSICNITIKVNDVVAVTYPGEVYTSYTFPPFVVNTGDVIVIHATGTGYGGGWSLVTIESTGKVVGEKTFDLSGKWLALGLDMKGLAATVKIQGAEVPYSDYAKWFPFVPTELKIPGNWVPLQERPEIRVYKGV